MVSVNVAVVVLLLLPAVSSLALRKRKTYRFQDEGYSDEVTRKLIYPMSAAAYSDDPSKCVANTFGSEAEIVGQASVKCDFPGDKCFAFTVVSHADEAIIISFQGTTSVSELKVLLNQNSFGHENFTAGGKVGRWYMNAFTDLWKAGIKDQYLQARNKYPQYQVWVTGHSTGGSLASICATEMIYEGVATADNLLMVTMAQPRTGNHDYARIHDQLVKHSFRVVHAIEMVAHLPPKNLLNYYHHGSEIWYKHNMGSQDSYKECTQGESNQCSDGLLADVNPFDSYFYFGIKQNVVDWGKGGCKV